MNKKDKIAVLGPKGTYTDLACDYYSKSYEKIYLDNITSVIKSVKNGIVEKGIIPAENSIKGTVVESLDGISEYDLFIEKSIIILIHHFIAGLSSKTKPEIIMSHPQAIGQCRKYINKNYPDSKIVKTLSTSEGFKKISEQALTNVAAIGSKKACELYDLKIIDENIEDVKNNKTEFFVISNKKEVKNDADKSLVFVYPKKDVQGILYKMLGYFNKEKINLTKIESRPSRKELGNYFFYIEFDGNINNEKVKKVLKNIKENIGFLKILGCYKKKKI
jgi:prephenate dehydratase